ncbi:hypothetical protein [Segetibacter aerophilus]|uniref:Uncharacterized protein n=1 Tax=Segetibacter aerophilus TaxID=670293 RepID=A0A512BIU7_9BACT|nr:hypothetical protein [Segetibacter aerophilus]GEO11795.1 hypothetical protein SAE01_42910 [Segetibacter aerophilus]
MELENKDSKGEENLQEQPQKNQIAPSNHSFEKEEEAANKDLHSFKLYEHGITNGILEVPPETFEQFITYYYEEINRDQRIARTTDEIADLSNKYKDARAKRLELVKKQLDRRADHGILILEANEKENKIKFWQQKVVTAKGIIEDLKQSVKTDYTLFAAIIFFLFALLFIAADYGIALNIVATNLQIGATTDSLGNPVFSPIAYLFAFAIAGLAIVLKPAFDRLVEKPYQKNGSKKVFAIFILISSGLVLSMLVAFGKFREELISMGLQIGEVSTDIADSSTAPTSRTPQETSGFAEYAIVSSTFLFAIAGAICLGISIPVIFKNYRIAWNNFRQKRWNYRVFKLNKEKLEIDSKSVKAEIDIKMVEDEIADLQEELGVKELIKDKKELLEVFIASKMQKLIEKSKAVYQDGYYRGSKLAGKVTEEWLNESVMSKTQYSNLGSSKVALPATTTGGSLSRTRPFIALRRMISQDFKNKVNKEGNINFEYYDFDK